MDFKLYVLPLTDCGKHLGWTGVPEAMNYFNKCHMATLSVGSFSVDEILLSKDSQPELHLKIETSLQQLIHSVRRQAGIRQKEGWERLIGSQVFLYWEIYGGHTVTKCCSVLLNKTHGITSNTAHEKTTMSMCLSTRQTKLGVTYSFLSLFYYICTASQLFLESGL